MYNDPQNDKPRRPHPLEGGAPEPTPQPRQPSERLVLNMEQERPIVTYVLIALNVFVFVVGMSSRSLQQQLFLTGWNDAMLVFGANEYYRLFSAMFLHGGLAHLLFNMYALYILGSQTEQMYGRWRYLSIYFLGGVTGSVLSAAFGDPEIPSVGASGAVFALLGAQILYFYRYRETLGEFGRGALQQYVVLFVINLFFGFAVPNIDNLGHIGGFIGGAILGWLLAPKLTAQRGVDYMGNALRVVNVEQRGGAEAVSAVYALGLVAFTMTAGFLLF